jgi:endonuclease-8
MPEGDAIFRTARTLERALAGRTVERFESVLPHLTRIDEDQAIAGRTVERVRSAGKHLLLEFSGGLVLRTHMRMNGAWHVYRRGERWRRSRHQMRVAIETDAFTAVAFNVPVAEFLTAKEMARAPALQSLGPDLLGEELDVDAAVSRLKAEGSCEIAEVLLDQRVVSGIGNVYKSEVCFLCGVSPFARMSELSDDQLRALVATARRLLQANVHAAATGQIVTRRTLRSMTGRAEAGEGVWVYGRAGKPCRRCGAIILRDKRGEQARSTYWCPQCARGSGPKGPRPHTSGDADPAAPENPSPRARSPHR